MRPILVPTTTSPSSSRRSRIAVGAVLIAALMAASFVSVPLAAALDPLPEEDAPTAGQELTIDYYSEPEFLLTTGVDRWNVRNTPDGTMAAAYGVPDDAVHDLYAKTGRYDPLPSASTGNILDISIRRAAPAFGLQHSWAFVRTDDGTAEVWGPADEGYPDRYVFEPRTDAPEDRIVGGTVVFDTLNERPAVHVFTRAGEVWQMHPDIVSGPVGVAGGNVVAAVARDHTAYEKPFYNSGTPRAGDRTLSPGERGAEPEAPGVMVVLYDDGILAHYPLRGTEFAFDDLELFPGRASTAGLPSDPIIDVDFGCIESSQATTASPILGGDEQHDGPFTGTVAERLTCPPPPPTSPSAPEPVRTLGRISVAVGSTGAGEPQVEVLTHADYVHFDLDSSRSLYTRTFSQSTKEVGCTLPVGDQIRAGSFDVRTVMGVTHLACIRPGDGQSDTTEIEHYLHPGLEYVFPDARVLESARSAALVWDDCINTLAALPSQRFERCPTADPSAAGGERIELAGAVQRRTFDRLGEIGSPNDPSAPIEETYEDLESLSVQLQFPCERLLGRPLGGEDGREIADCWSNLSLGGDRPEGASSPNGIASFTIAGFGAVGGERRLFVDNEPNIFLFNAYRTAGIVEAEGGAAPLPDPAQPEQVSWTIEPSPNLASDLEALAGDGGVDSTLFDAYTPPTGASPPPVLLTQIPRDLRTPVRIRIDSAEPRIQEKPTLPLAVLQAPPTVQGLGQQTDFTPEFAQTESSDSETTVSRSTRVGSHTAIEGVLTTGVKVLGVGLRVGGGLASSYEFMKEAEQELAAGLSVETTEGYGGAFDDHTVVTRSVQEYVWDATVLEDPSGFTTGQSFEYGIPAGELTQAVPLRTLEEESPGLYGANGAFRPTVDAILGGIEIGDPGSYPAGAAVSQPPSVLRANGGACSGGYAAPGDRTPPDGRLNDVVLGEGNPYFGSDPRPPTGPSIVTSASHAVSAGNGLTESAAITFSTTTSESQVTSKSHDWGVTGIFKFSAGSSDTGPNFELTVEQGVDSGFSTGNGVTDTLGEGSGLTTVMGNIPFSPDGKPWVEDEEYTWRMYMCKAQLGPAGIGSEIWVQGYVVDGYDGSGGVEDLAPVDAQKPVASAVAFADPTASPTGTVENCAAVGTRGNRFEWDQQAGTVDRYAIELTNVTGGGGEQRVIADLERPGDFDPSSSRVDCAGIAAGDFVDGDLYRWRAVVDGFTDNRETSDWEFFRPQVWPPAQTLSLRTPIIHPDDSVTIDIDDPIGVKSLRHDITVFAIDSDTGARTQVAEGRSILTDDYRTPTLEPGRYEAEVVGHNSHVLDAGGRAETPPVTVQFEVEETLRSQFTYGGCSEDPCNTTDLIEFTDESLPANDVPIVAWSWYFGDGTTSTERHPIHRFVDLPEDGSNAYDVFLTVTDATGQTAALQQQVPVQSAAPEIDTAGLETDIGVDQELTMQLSATDPDNAGRGTGDQQIPTFEWDLDGDGLADATEQTFESSVTHAFGAAGEHPVTVVVTDPFGRTDTHAFVVTVHAPPTADFTHTSCDAAIAPDDPSCAAVGSLVTFDPAPSTSTAGDLVAWEWDFGNGTTRLVTDPAEQVVGTRYREAGTPSVTLRVRDRFGQWSAAFVRAIGIVRPPHTGGGGGGGGGAGGGGAPGGDEPVVEDATESACLSMEATGTTFTDIEASTHREAIECAALWGTVTGFSDGTFGTRLRISRGQAASMMTRALATAGVDVPNDAPDAFTDDGGVHDGNVNALAAMGISEGYGDGTYRPSRYVSRAQIASMFARTYAVIAGQALPTGDDAFTDDDGSAHEADINAVAAAGWVNGVGEGVFAPQQPMVRGQFASVLVRMLSTLVDEGLATPPAAG